MRIKAPYLVIAFLAAGSMPAVAAGNSGASSNQQASAKSDASSTSSEEKKICKRLETSGSRLAERVCLTKAQWKKVESGT